MQIFQSLDSLIYHPTLVLTDSETTLTQVFKDRLIPKIRHLDVMVCWLDEHRTCDDIIPKYINTSKMEADINTKTFGGESLQFFFGINWIFILSSIILRTFSITQTSRLQYWSSLHFLWTRYLKSIFKSTYFGIYKILHKFLRTFVQCTSIFIHFYYLRILKPICTVNS